MATEHTTVFVPLVEEARRDEYTANDFEITPHQNDGGVDIVFSVLEWDDRSVFMVAPGEVFFVAAGTTISLVNGPEVVAPTDRNVVVVHVVSTYQWAPILATTGQPVAEWWALEGILAVQFELFVNTHDLEALAGPRGFANGAELHTAILSGTASLNVLLADGNPVSLGTVGTAGDDQISVGLRTWASSQTGVTELDALNTLAAIKQLAPEVNDHPLIGSVLSNISTSDVTIHVRFVYWETKRDADGSELDATSETDKGTFEPVPATSTIAIQRRSAVANYATIAEESVVDNGQVALTVSRADLTITSGESFVFRLELPGGKTFETQYQHEQTPRATAQKIKWNGIDNVWNTVDRSTTDGAIEALNFLAAVESNSVGSVNQPLEYYAGIPVFLQVQYPVVYVDGAGVSSTFRQVIRKAPKGLRVEVLSLGTARGEFRTDENGQIWGMLLESNEADVSLDFRVHYEMKDETIGLLPFKGEVVENNQTYNFYDRNTDHYTGESYMSHWQQSTGNPAGDAIATELATLQIGTVTISKPLGVSKFESVDGRHAGLVHALQQIRYIHQWFYYLTEGFMHGGGLNSWESVLSSHNGTAGISTGGNYTVELPRVRVQEEFASAEDPQTHDMIRAQTNYGFVDIDKNEIPKLRWWLTLQGFDSFRMNEKLKVYNDTRGSSTTVDIRSEDKVQFWRDHTIWHEYTHAVLNMAVGRLFNLDTHIAFVLAKDVSTSSLIDQPIRDGWSVLEEAVAAIPEAALCGEVTGITPKFQPSPAVQPPAVVPTRHMLLNVDTDSDGVPDLLLSQGMTTTHVEDWRLGLRVPIAFTWGLWTALQELAGFKTLYHIFGGPPTGNDLKDTVGYLDDLDARRIFRNLIWGPLVALGTPQDAGPPAQWDDIDGTKTGYTTGDAEGKGAAGPAFGTANSRRTRINGPSTHRFMEILAQQFWGKFKGDEPNQLRDLFGDADDILNLEEVSFYLWFDF